MCLLIYKKMHYPETHYTPREWKRKLTTRSALPLIHHPPPIRPPTSCLSQHALSTQSSCSNSFSLNKTWPLTISSRSGGRTAPHHRARIVCFPPIHHCFVQLACVRLNGAGWRPGGPALRIYRSFFDVFWQTNCLLVSTIHIPTSSYTSC